MIRLPSLVDLDRAARLRVTVAGTITEIDPDDTQGVRHQIFSIRVDEVIDDPDHAGVSAGEPVNAAIRYGDPGAMPQPIPDLAVGEPITLCGAYVPAEQAYPEADGDLAAVIHFTHRPFGWVEYHGVRYG